MTTVITGASGFIAGALVRALLAEGRTVRAVDLQRGPTLEGLDVEFARADVLDVESLRPVFQGAEIVHHLAALISIAGDPDGRVWRTNVDGVRNVARVAFETGVRRMVHCSSVHSFDIEAGNYPITELSIRSTAPGLPVYDRSKAEGEAQLKAIARAGLDTVVVNPTGVIGPFDFGRSAMGQVFEALFRGQLPGLVKGGFDWVDSRDVAASMIVAEKEGRPGENYLLPGHHKHVSELASLAADLSGVAAPRLRIPMWVARASSPIGAYMGRRRDSALWYTSESLRSLEFSPEVSGAKAERELGHTARPTGESVRDIYEWLEAEGRLA